MKTTSSILTSGVNQRKREDGRRNCFMTKSPGKNVPDVGIELGAASDRATAPGLYSKGSAMCQ